MRPRERRPRDREPRDRVPRDREPRGREPRASIVNLEIVNFGGEGAIRRQGEIDVTSDSLKKDLTEGPVWTQG